MLNRNALRRCKLSPTTFYGQSFARNAYIAPKKTAARITTTTTMPTTEQHSCPSPSSSGIDKALKTISTPTTLNTYRENKPITTHLTSNANGMQQEQVQNNERGFAKVFVPSEYGEDLDASSYYYDEIPEYPLDDDEEALVPEYPTNFDCRGDRDGGGADCWQNGSGGSTPVAYQKGMSSDSATTPVTNRRRHCFVEKYPSTDSFISHQRDKLPRVYVAPRKRKIPLSSSSIDSTTPDSSGTNTSLSNISMRHYVGSLSNRAGELFASSAQPLVSNIWKYLPAAFSAPPQEIEAVAPDIGMATPTKTVSSEEDHQPKSRKQRRTLTLEQQSKLEVQWEYLNSDLTIVESHIPAPTKKCVVVAFDSASGSNASTKRMFSDFNRRGKV